MPWRTITSEDVLDEFTPAETSSLRAIQGAADKLPGIVERVVRSVRGRIVAGGTPLGADNTIPDQFATEVIDIARWRWLISFPQLKSLQSEERKGAYERAMETLERIEKGALRIEDPTSENVVDTPRPHITAKTRSYTHDDYQGT